MTILALILLILLPILLLFLSNKKRNNAIPGPRGLPILGNMLQIDNSAPHIYLGKLSQKYGEIMSIRFGSVPILVISSAKLAKEVLKTNDLTFCSRPSLLGQKKLSYNGVDMAFSPYNDYWREIRKICVLHLFSVKKVQSFRHIRGDEASRMIQKISELSSNAKVVNLSEMAVSMTSSLTCRIVFGKRYENEGQTRSRFHGLLSETQAVIGSFYFSDYLPYLSWVDRINGILARLEKNFNDMDMFYQELIDDHLSVTRPESMKGDFLDILLTLKRDKLTPIDLTYNQIKAVLMNIILGGTDTGTSTIIWAMAALMKDHKLMKKVQDEIRSSLVPKDGILDEDIIRNLPYFSAVIKEAMRLYPAAPLLIPRETMEKCSLNGYEIPPKTTVYVNAWAVGRDPEAWENPEEFYPERFLNSSIDFIGQDHFEFIPFGAGRRGCPGLNMGISTVELALANLLYYFDWDMPNGVKSEDIDMDTKPGVTIHKKNDLCLLAKKYETCI